MPSDHRTLGSPTTPPDPSDPTGPTDPDPLRVLFVCTGNVCRSPVAEYLIRHRLGSDGARVAVCSAGIVGVSAHPMDARSLDYLQGKGIDGRRFLARRVNRRILADQDLVICFEQRQVDACLALHPGAMSTTFRLTQLAAWHRTGVVSSLSELRGRRHLLPWTENDLEDPVGFTSLSDYIRILDTINADIAELSALLTSGGPE